MSRGSGNVGQSSIFCEWRDMWDVEPGRLLPLLGALKLANVVYHICHPGWLGMSETSQCVLSLPSVWFCDIKSGPE
jgi:hypothetical protein